MAGLLNIVPRYLPRYGMAPEWGRATRPLVCMFTTICFVVTILFDTDVDAQGGAYATGVLTLMGSAAIAVTLSAWRQHQGWLTVAFSVITSVFIYTIITNIVERPEGLRIAALFIGVLILISLISRIWRSTELRVKHIAMDPLAEQFISEASHGKLRIIANQYDTGDPQEYAMKEREVREDTHIPATDPVLFLEVHVHDASEFEHTLCVRGYDVAGYRVLRTESTAVPNAIAAFLLYVRDQTGKLPHIYFGWTEGNPFTYLVRFIVFGEGEIAPLTREILREAERNPKQRPGVHVGG